jgi:hypothetical protein
VAAPASPPACPRCGQQAALRDGAFCSNCGRYLQVPGPGAALRWVAEPPPAATLPPPPPRFRPRYAGPPRYRGVPRWGFRPGPWVGPGEPPTPGPLDAARGVAGSAVPLLWATAVVALVAAGAEAWRYHLLLASREGALSAREVAASDALVLAAGTVAPLLGLLAGGLFVTWTVRASAAAADRAGLRSSRSPREIVLGWLVPGVNLVVPGAVLAEIEHAALDRPASRRPRPSRAVTAWWVLWASSVVLAGIVLLWSLRAGVQALADGVVLHAVLDLAAAATAGWSAVLVTRLTRLLGPVRPARREVLVRATGRAPSSTAPAARA